MDCASRCGTNDFQATFFLVSMWRKRRRQPADRDDLKASPDFSDLAIDGNYWLSSVQ